MPIKRGSRMFIELRSVGEVDENDKVVLSMDFRGKVIAKPDRPLALVVGLMEQVVQMSRYSSAEALETDLREFRAYVDSLKARKPEPPSPPAPAEAATS